MAVVEITGTVEASPHDVYEIVSDPERFSEWFPEITESRLINGSGVGAERFVKGDMMGDWTSKQRITVAKPDREFAWTHLSDTGKPQKFLSGVTHRVGLRGHGGRTTVALRGDFATKGMGKMMAPMIKMKMRKKYQGAIELIDGLVRASRRRAA